MHRKAEEMICERCGLVSNGYGMAHHQKACDRLPLPDQLVADLLNGLSLHRIGQIYGTSASVIKKRALLSPDAVFVVWRRSKKKVMTEPRCECGVLLEHPDVPLGDGVMCGYCVAEAREREAKVMT